MDEEQQRSSGSFWKNSDLPQLSSISYLEFNQYDFRIDGDAHAIGHTYVVRREKS